ncbi:MAG: UDP-N-acetylmuramyl-tripeptide synthetase [Candidatus Taylorbacteria bacterium]|nr:UDP-N-acetylmuramyl-tripeptide synthetase [Candidatus Taylorbacteria bacterium]
MLDNTLSTIRRFIPKKIFSFFQPAYHKTLSFMATLWYGFPSKKIKVIAVTGTKGKSSTVEIITAILEEAGFKTALSNTIRFKIGSDSKPNLFKMSTPGRFFLQKLLRKAVSEGCQYAVIELTSQGALLFRHRFIELDAFIFTNIQPEHIEAHGSLENYIDAKVSICRNISDSKKKNRVIIANKDDKECDRFLECQADRKISYGLKDAEPYKIYDTASELKEATQNPTKALNSTNDSSAPIHSSDQITNVSGIEFTLNGKTAHSPLNGLFNLYNILAATSTAKSQGVSDEVIIKAIEKFKDIPGRVQKIEESKIDFTVVVDYAHTTDSLEKLYQAFDSQRKICVLGGTGGGRDTWKRKEMGKIADAFCDEIILTNEDPYDEDPDQIVSQIAEGIVKHKAAIIMDRRKAIEEAVKMARKRDAVLITGKGTDPYIMGPDNSKEVWSDAEEARKAIRSAQGASTQERK